MVKYLFLPQIAVRVLLSGIFSFAQLRKISGALNIVNAIIVNAQDYSGDNGPASSANLNRVSGLWGNTLGTLYICDSHNNRIRAVDLSSYVITTIAGGAEPGSSGWCLILVFQSSSAVCDYYTVCCIVPSVHQL